MPQKTVMPNGIRIVTEFVPGVRSATIGCWLGVGSREETPSQLGYAHVAEHMMFKGTATRTARDIAETMDATGGHLNAFTSKEITAYYARVLDEHVPLALELLADMLLNSRFDAEELARERQVILEEIMLIEDSPEDFVHDAFDEALFGTHPLARSVLGNRESVARCTREALLRFVKTHYNPHNVVIAAAGNVQHDAFVAQVAPLFAPLQADEPPRTNGAARHAYEPRRTFIHKDTEQVHLCVGAPGLRRGHPDRFALMLLDAVLGGGMSSRLFQELRETRGLVYATYSYTASYRDTGVFGVYAGTGPHRTEEVLDLINAQLDELYRGRITKAELARAREQLKGSTMLGLENTSARMSRLATAELWGEPYLSPEQLIEHVEAVTLADVQRVAAKLLAPEKLTTVALGPVSDQTPQPMTAEAMS